MVDNFKALEQMTPEEFANECKTESLGNLHSMKVLVGVAYEQCKMINDDLMKKLAEENAPEEEEELKKLYDNLVMVMMNLENKYNIILETIKGIPVNFRENV